MIAISTERCLPLILKWGYKDIADLRDWLTNAGLCILGEETMPANNLAIIAEKRPD